MAPTVAIDAAVSTMEDPLNQPAPRALTDWERRKVLITAAATAALGAPVRVISITPVKTPVNRWVRSGRAGRGSVAGKFRKRASVLPIAPTVAELEGR